MVEISTISKLSHCGSRWTIQPSQPKHDSNWSRPKKKLHVFPLTLPTLIFCDYPEVFFGHFWTSTIKVRMCLLLKLAKNIFKNKIFFLPTDPNILEHVSGNTGIFFLGHIDFIMKQYIFTTCTCSHLKNLHVFTDHCIDKTCMMYTVLTVVSGGQGHLIYVRHRL